MKADVSISLTLEGDELLEFLDFLKKKKKGKVSTVDIPSSSSDASPAQPAVPDYEPDPNSILDLLCSKKRSLHAALFSLPSRLADNSTTLLFNSEGIVSRIITKDGRLMVDVRIPKRFFKVYHVKEHVRLSVALRLITASITLRGSKRDYHLQVFKGGPVRTGEREYEHAIKAESIEQSETPFAGETALQRTLLLASAELSFDMFRSIMSEITWLQNNSIHIDKDGLTFTAANQEHQFSKTISATDKGVTISALGPIKRLYNSAGITGILQPFANAAVSIVRLKLYESVMCIEPVFDDGNGDGDGNDAIEYSIYVATFPDSKDDNKEMEMPAESLPSIDA